MYDFETGEFRPPDEPVQKIARFEVWFATPVGLFAAFEDAVTAVKGLEMNPTLLIQPVPVIIGTLGAREAVVRS